MTEQETNDTIELVIYNPNAVKATITFNYDEVKQKLENYLGLYKGLVYTDNTIGNAKKDRANLNKLADGIETERKAVKKEYDKPYNDFKAKVDSLVALITNVNSDIDTKVKEYEAKAKDAKKAEIKICYDENIKFKDIVPLESIYQKEWENQTYSMKKVLDDMQARVAKYLQDIRTIDSIGGAFVKELKNIYVETQSMDKVLDEKARYDRVIASIPTPVAPVIETPKVVDSVLEDGQKVMTLRLTTDNEKMAMLIQFIVFNEIKMEVL
jgi:hypothetical protein